MTKTNTTVNGDKKLLQTSIGIIGGGWFGQAFAKNLIAGGHQQVLLTTQTPDKLAQFEAIGAKGELLSLPADQQQLVEAKVLQQQLVIIAIPPGFKKGRTDYADNIAAIVAAAELGKVEQIILLNSTAIYNGLAGEVNEQSELQLSAPKVALLAQAEQALFQFSKQACSLRLAGLVGEDRHPGRFVARAIEQNRALPEPHAYVNLIHQADVIGLVKALATANASGVFNGVSATHTEKAEYYRLAAQSLGLAAPAFSTSSAQLEQSKKVIGELTRQQLNYHYQYDDLLAWVANANANNGAVSQ